MREAPARSSVHHLLVTSVWVLSACRSAESRELATRDLPTLVAEEEMRLGDLNDPDIGFSQVTSVDVDRDGAIYVVEAADRQIRVYTPDGSILRRIGGPGDGPGEFRGIPRFGVVGDTVWTWDSSANRITLFNRHGTLLSTARTDGLPIALWSGCGFIRPWEMRPDGLFTGDLTRVGGCSQGETTDVQPSHSVPIPRILFDASGAIVDTIGWDGAPPARMARPPAMEPEMIRRAQVGERRMYVPVPPATLPDWVQLHDGRIIVEALYASAAADGMFTITRLGLDRDTVYHRVYRYEPVPYSAEEPDFIAQRAARGAPGGGVPYARGPGAPPPPDNVEVIARALRAEMAYPPFRLPLLYTQVGEDESLWLLRDTGDSPTARWILLDHEALPRGQLLLPSSMRILWMDADEFWAVVPGDYEVPFLVRYRIRPG